MRAVTRAIGVFALVMTGVAAMAQAPAKTDSMGKLDIMLMKPTAPKMGGNEFEVMVKDGGKAVTKADVSLLLVMPATPTMGEMRSTVKLKAMGDGLYAGPGNVTMGGTWNVTIDVMQNGKSLGQKKVTLTAK